MQQSDTYVYGKDSIEYPARDERIHTRIGHYRQAIEKTAASILYIPLLL